METIISLEQNSSVEGLSENILKIMKNMNSKIKVLVGVSKNVKDKVESILNIVESKISSNKKYQVENQKEPVSELQKLAQELRMFSMDLGNEKALLDKVTV
ncbi:MAG: hypothetical protein PHO80_01585 [Candidatus Gracilibacteria bacterium]|nr:hypothetical protein [Candidatus Gracilibacteria bacterium]